MSSPLPWYVVYAKPRQEALALEHLQRQGFEAYLPLIEVLQRPRAGTPGPASSTWVLKPLFPRYLFVRPARADQSVRPIQSTTGVTHLVRFGHQLATLSHPVLQQLIEALQTRREGDRTAAALRDLHFTPGRRARVTEGPFAGLEGWIQGSDAQRVHVLLNLLGKAQSLRFEPHQLEAVAPPKPQKV